MQSDDLESGIMTLPQILSDMLIGGLLVYGLLASPSLTADPVGVSTSDRSSVKKLENPSGVSLAQLAAAADVIALVQMRDGDYRYQRSFPVSGSAHLKVLIPYKVDRPMDMIEVYEIGLHPNECYFPNPSVFEEGRRYLVFLRHDSEVKERYRGLPQGCALDVLVTADNAYALRIPATGIDLSDDLLQLTRKLEFADPYAYVSTEELDSVERDTWLNRGWLRSETSTEGQVFVYTQGIPLNDVRNLLGPDGISMDRHQKRLPTEP
jgi:hypothetical protein